MSIDLQPEFGGAAEDNMRIGHVLGLFAGSLDGILKDLTLSNDRNAHLTADM